MKKTDNDQSPPVIPPGFEPKPVPPPGEFDPGDFTPASGDGK